MYVPSAASGLAVRLTARTVPSLITTSAKDCEYSKVEYERRGERVDKEIV